MPVCDVVATMIKFKPIWVYQGKSTDIMWCQWCHFPVTACDSMVEPGGSPCTTGEVTATQLTKPGFQRPLNLDMLMALYELAAAAAMIAAGVTACQSGLSSLHGYSAASQL